MKGQENRKAIAYIIQRLGLSEHAEKSWVQLSGGYKLRFTLAKALVWKPRLLILDEPLANLDIKTQVVVLNDLLNLVKSLRHPLAVLISSQQLHEIEAVADHLLFMQGGELAHQGRTADYGDARQHNTFELGCALTYAGLAGCLEGFPYEKLWYNGMSYFITTPLEVSGFDLLQHLAGQQVQCHYCRDISRSIKTKFYEAHL